MSGSIRVRTLQLDPFPTLMQPSIAFYALLLNIVFANSIFPLIFFDYAFLCKSGFSSLHFFWDTRCAFPLRVERAEFVGSDIDEDIFYAQIIFVGILAGGFFLFAGWCST